MELTVHIGKELLSHNTSLERKVEQLEKEVKLANENNAQLSHELNQKIELINILTDNENIELPSPTSLTAGASNINYDMLQKKINYLESENRTLHSEVAQVVKETDEIEEKERQLFNELTSQLNSRNDHLENLEFDIERYKEENRLQNEQIVNMSTRLSDTQMRLHEVINEHEETISLLAITKENQNSLVAELAELREKYQETLALLHECQTLLREKKKKIQPMHRPSFVAGLPAPYNSNQEAMSLQTELNQIMESSLFSEHSLDSGIHSDGSQPKQAAAYKKVFETVKTANNSNAFKNSAADLSMVSSTELISHQPRMASSIYSADNAKSSEKLGSFSMYSSIYGDAARASGDVDHFLTGSSDTDDSYESKNFSGVPGCPGARDLESALKNLSSAEILARRAMLSHAPAGTYSYDEPMQCHTPESLFSNSTSSTFSQYRYPKKLEIVKPLEGSFTLNHWKGLATPAMSGLLNENERVKVRGEKGLDELGLTLYSLEDVEEDVDDLPLKQYDSTHCIYTYTNSYVMHPEDGTASITFSLPPSQMSSQMSSRQPTRPSTPRTLSRRNSCSTFSVSVGLASMLNERGIKAVTPSCLNTPSGANYSPTITPCNSPTGSSSPTHSSSSRHHVQHNEISLTSFLTSSAGALKKRFIGHHDPEAALKTSRLEKKAKLRSIRMLENVGEMGIENILTNNNNSRLVSPLALHSSNIYTRYNSSPMTQLTSLKHLNDKKMPSEVDETAKENINELSSDVEETTMTAMKSPQNSSTPLSRAKSKVARQKSRRNMNGNASQRSDLGTVNTSKDRKSPVDDEKSEEKSLVGGFVGSISSIFFGRKGGYL